MSSAPKELLDYEEDVLQLLFAPDPEPPLSRLCRSPEDREGWLTYRDMTRGRMRDVLASALPRTRRRLGERFEPFVISWLEASPPVALVMRDVVTSFARRLEESSLEPKHIPDLARYERALLEIGWLAEPAGLSAATTREVVFEQVPVLAPMRRLLVSSWNVHMIPFEADGEEAVAEGEFAVLVFRSARDGLTATRWLEPFDRALFEAICETERPLVESVRTAASRVGREIDASLLETLSELLAEWVDSGLWVGSR